MDESKDFPGLPSVAAGAVATHELFLSYVKAGFTEHQALYLIAQMLRPLPPPTT